jgi:hypothetical protein
MIRLALSARTSTDDLQDPADSSRSTLRSVEVSLISSMEPALAE